MTDDERHAAQEWAEAMEAIRENRRNLRLYSAVALVGMAVAVYGAVQAHTLLIVMGCCLAAMGLVAVALFHRLRERVHDARSHRLVDIILAIGVLVGIVTTVAGIVQRSWLMMGFGIFVAAMVGVTWRFAGADRR